jgi:hypothetical protein
MGAIANNARVVNNFVPGLVDSDLIGQVSRKENSTKLVETSRFHSLSKVKTRYGLLTIHKFVRSQIENEHIELPHRRLTEPSE